MQSSKLAILHEQELFPTLTGEGPKAGWTHILLQIFSKRKTRLAPASGFDSSWSGYAPLKPCRLVVLALKCNDLYPYPVTSSVSMLLLHRTYSSTIETGTLLTYQAADVADPPTF